MADMPSPGPAPWPSREQQLSPLIEIAERSLTVFQLAELNLWWADAAQSARSAHEWMDEHGFDAAPVNDAGMYRFIEAGPSLLDDRPVIEHAQLVDSRLLVSADLGLADGISRLRRQPYYFVLQGERLRGIATRADLQRPAVSMVLFSLILASESAADLIVPSQLGESWLDHLQTTRREKIEKAYSSRKKKDAQVTHLECLTLSDRLNLLGDCQHVLPELGFSSRNEFAEWKKKILSVRNRLAHGETLLHAEKDPVKAIELFQQIRNFAQKVWDFR